jgi:hypothetical protein
MNDEVESLTLGNEPSGARENVANTGRNDHSVALSSHLPGYEQSVISDTALIDCRDLVGGRFLPLRELIDEPSLAASVCAILCACPFNISDMFIV